MSERRKEKLSELYKRAATSFLQKQVIFENSVFSITNVELSDKLNHLKIYFSVWPDGKEKDMIKLLEGLKKELRGELAEEIKTKFVPEINFVFDDSEKKRLRIEELLKKNK